MEVKRGYKQTEVGVIPEEWEDMLLDRIAKRGSGHTPDKKHTEYWHGSIKWISLADSPALDRVFIDDTFAKVTPEGIANSSAVLHPAGTVVLSRDAGVGKSAIMRTEMAVSQHFMAWRCGPELDNHYLYYWLQAAKLEFERIANGSTIKTIGLPYFKDLKIPYPPLPEQRAIATALSDVDALLGALDRLIAKKRDLKQAAMQQLLTGQTRLPGFHGEWEVKRLGEMAEIVMGQSPISSNYNTQGDGLPLIQGNADVANRKTIMRVFTTQIAKRGRTGDVLMSVRAPVGEVSRATFDVCLGRGVCAIRYPNDFLYHCLIFLEPTWAKHSKGSTFDSVNSTDVKAVEIKLPSDLPEQTAIAAVLTDMDAELALLEQRLAKTRALKQGMMQELLTGRTRLV